MTHTNKEGAAMDINMTLGSEQLHEQENTNKQKWMKGHEKKMETKNLQTNKKCNKRGTIK